MKYMYICMMILASYFLQHGSPIILVFLVLNIFASFYRVYKFRDIRPISGYLWKNDAR